MQNKHLIIGVIASFVLVLGSALLIFWEVRKSTEFDEKVRKMSRERKQVIVSDNRDFNAYETITSEDNREMVLVPEGVFTRGSAEGEFDEKPQQEVYLDAFYVDKYEVSVKDYEVYRSATKYVRPTVPFFQGDEKVLSRPEMPVVGVSWDDAVNYCRWGNKRLLTEAEWEKAARGTQGLIYPWGNQFLPQRANISGFEDGYEFMAPVGSFPMGRSMYGIFDMAGNVSEWVQDWYDQFYYAKAPMMNPPGFELSKNRVFRGGSWDARKTDVRSAKRFAATPGRKDSILGFRCGLSKKDYAG